MATESFYLETEWKYFSVCSSMPIACLPTYLGYLYFYTRNQEFCFTFMQLAFTSERSYLMLALVTAILWLLLVETRAQCHKI